MDLPTYLSRPGAVVELARAIDAHPSLISQLKNKRRPIPARFCPKIEKATGGLVTCEEMLKDVDWTYLRGTDPNLKSAHK